ncbi:hypothetical protein CMI37_08515 [Candidatus Pacearchaeota archaeon]|nr:hypothetical protein [Candidatus Pacearchaeota archaeon]|tara:strand:+ start:6048 stop:6533 length:486 start_codon:yes stop_codon:yes gene_type:complete
MGKPIADMLNFYNCCPSSIVAANEDIFNGDPSSDVVSMAKYEACVFVIVKNAGATGTATITVEACDDTTPTTSTAIAFRYKVCTSGNTWGAWAEATSSGFTTTAGANQCYIMQVLAEDLGTSDQFVRLVATEVVDSPCDGAILCVLGSPRYAMDVLPDVTS